MKPRAKFLNNPHLQLLTIAGAVAITASTLGLSAYLADVTDPLTMNLQLKYGDNFSIAISDINKELYEDTQVITPGETVPFEPSLSNTGNYPVYVFMEVNLPDQDFSLQGLGSEWTEIESDGERAVYGYGSSKSLQKLEGMKKDSNGEPVYDATPELCSSIKLDAESDLEEQLFTVSAVGYAIQTDLNNTDPESVWSAVEEQLTKDASSGGSGTSGSSSSQAKKMNTGGRG